MLEYTDPRECSREPSGTSTCIFHVLKISFIVCFIMNVLVKAIHISLINKCKYIGEMCKKNFCNKMHDFKSLDTCSRG